MNLNNILNLFSDITSVEVREMKTMNNGNFLKGIQDGDIEIIKELLKIGLDFNSTKFWKELNDLDPCDINDSIYEFLLNDKFNSVGVDSDVIKDAPVELRMLLGGGKKINKSTFTSSFVIKEMFKDKIIKHLISDKTPFNEKLFLIAIDNVDSYNIYKNTDTLLKKIGQSDISQYSDKLHEYITSKGLVHHLFDSINNTKSLNSFINSKYYSLYFEHASEDTKIGMMDYALAKGQIEKVKALHKFGFSLSNCSKGSYSELFMMTTNEGHDTQNYLVSSIDDITTGNHVILKTLIHFKYRTSDHEKKMILINHVLDKYSDDIIELVPGLLTKREDTERVLFVKRYYNHRVLKKELNNELDDSKNNLSIKKLKI